MKKHIIVFALIIYFFVGGFLIANKSKESFFASTNGQTQYAKVITGNACLYKTCTSLNDSSNVLFLLEESYFVKILDISQNNFYHVEYLNQTGYVLSNQVELVNENIQNPYLSNITFSIAKDCFLYSEPKNNQNLQVLTLTKGQTISYYGKIYSDEIFENSGNMWYYCCITNSNNKIFGYVHASQTNNLSPIKANTEVSTKLITKTEVQNILNLNISSQSIIIAIISLPVLFLLFIFLKGFKKV